jgi:hypothetical protein
MRSAAASALAAHPVHSHELLVCVNQNVPARTHIGLFKYLISLLEDSLNTICEELVFPLLVLVSYTCKHSDIHNSTWSPGYLIELGAL